MSTEPDVEEAMTRIDADEIPDSGEDDGGEGQWQDKNCQGPMETTGELSPLCKACTYIFSGFQVYGNLGAEEIEKMGGRAFTSAWNRHLEQLSVLESSARRGCAMCTLLLSKIRRRSESLKPVESAKMRYRVNVREQNLVGSALAHSTPWLEFTYEGSHADREPIVRTVCEPMEFGTTFKGDFTDTGISHTITPNTLSSSSLRLAENWLARCSVYHESCNATRTQDDYHPTRLLDLGISGEGSVIRLIETKESACNGPYAALSHCWGGSLPIVLKEENIHALKKSIRLEELPKTFQHGVYLARYLNNRYLWIDSLCIIQDSEADWEREATCMKDVYRNAHVTVAATGAAKSSVGCFFDRDVNLIKTVTVSISWQGARQGIYEVCDGNIWQEDIVNAPLNQRAWVVQERLLSPRILHFGREQIAWECQWSNACETFPDQLPPTLWPFGDDYFKSLLEESSDDLIALHWEEIASTYSQGRLTTESDKCIALSGIVDAIQSHTTDEYLAGLWKSQFIRHLCWSIMALDNREQPRLPRRSLNYRAPSWSWLSIESSIQYFGRVCALEDDNSKSMMDIIHVDIQNTGQSKLGPIQSGQIVARGYLRKARWDHVPGDQGKMLAVDDLRIPQGEFWNFMPSQVIMDVGADDPLQDVFCLTLLEHKTPEHRFQDGEYVGLILAATGEEVDKYRRVGCFQLSWESSESLMKEDRGDGIRIEVPRRLFTIV